MNKKSKEKIILGLVGEIASGKDTVADYLAKKYHSQTISFSKPLRDILDRLYLPQSRINLADLGIILREEFGQAVLEKVTDQEIKNSPKKIVCLPNIRLKSDMAKLKKLKHFILIGLATDLKIRYQRILKRAQNTDDKNKTWTEFLKDSKLSTETEIRKIAKTAKFTIDNNGSYQNLYAQIDKIMKKIK